MRKIIICKKTAPIFQKLGKVNVTSPEQLEEMRLSNSELAIIKKTNWSNYKLSEKQFLVVQCAKNYAHRALELRKDKNLEKHQASRHRAKLKKCFHLGKADRLLAQEFEANMTCQMSAA